MKIIKILAMLFIIGVTLAALGAAGFALWVGHAYEKPGPLDKSASLIISPGDNIAARLQSVGAIDNLFIFKLSARFSGAESRLKAGEYEIPAHASIKEILDLLESGKVILRQITIPEGLTNWQVEQILQGDQNLQQAESLPDYAEGTLLPETYSYQQGENAADILQRMERAMQQSLLTGCGIMLEAKGNKTLSDLLDMDCPNAPPPLKTLKDVLILASIIEKETGKAEERKTIAGVFINRLRKEIALQSDPTVIYALTGGKPKNDGKGPLGRRLLKKDLEADSPYNTYKYPGLPPGPIANPGSAAIEAALHPEQNDYLYFVADGSGGHVFAKTLREHTENVGRWRQIRRQQADAK